MLIATSAACGAGGIRPRYGPLTGAVTDTVQAEPDAVIRELQTLVRAESLPVGDVSAREGYLETRWFNAETKRWGGGASLNTGAIVKFRFWTDALREGTTIVVGEAARRRVVDPSLPGRQTEVAVDQGHAGDVMLRRLLDSLRARTER